MGKKFGCWLLFLIAWVGFGVGMYISFLGHTYLEPQGLVIFDFIHVPVLLEREKCK